ncbi:hypothetical protein V1517DRAFT_375748 [Lipomyces orientalis]|uniref:Uncharacterized protein n=1 Tax=Lipomyces orientalis TaxID=1233043 RepID=A0ACC3TGH0_9ASCO
MGTRGLEIVRFRRRYYIRFHQYDSYFEGLGAKIIAGIPADPEEYQKWVKSMRVRYADKERALEQHVYEIRDGHEPDYSQFREFVVLPSELPRLNGYDAEFFYTINLDHEVLTMNHSIHWKLGNIPRQDNLWLHAIADSVYRYIPTISPDVCPEEHMASLALELPERIQEIQIDYAFCPVTPRTNIEGTRTVFLTYVLTRVLIEYMDEIIRFGMEWSPDSFPFRELTFALVSIASGQAKFHSFPAQPCNPRDCSAWDCKSNHLSKSPGWLDKEWAGDSAPLLEFGSLSHRAGEPPGASPTDTMYWLEDVLVSLTLVVDREAITKAVTWGIEHGRTNFQAVVLSLFKVAFAEVSFNDDGSFVKVSQVVNLSPLCADYCVSTHPRERPELKPGMKFRRQTGELIMNSNCTGTVRRLQNHFPGLAALVNFFDVAVSRRAASKAGFLPPELYNLILDFVDYDTWKTCSVVSRELRSYCLLKYRLDDRMRIVAGPFVRLQEYHKERLLSFNFENMQTGKILPMMQVPRLHETTQCNWMPVIGSQRKALMLDTVVQFEPAGDVPVEADSDNERSIAI